jgi:hypothetical protein
LQEQFFHRSMKQITGKDVAALLGNAINQSFS